MNKFLTLILENLDLSRNCGQLVQIGLIFGFSSSGGLIELAHPIIGCVT
jgi:hypothetical protein